VIPGLSELFSQLTYAVGFDNPLSIGILYLMGVLTDIGVPLLLTLEIFLMFASYYTGPLAPPVLLMISILLLGRETGAAVLYWVSHLAGEPFLKWLERHFPWVSRSEKRLKARIKRRTTLMVVLVRLTPGFLQIPSIIAGSLGLNYLRFVIGVAIASLIYDFGLVLFGFIARLVSGTANHNLQDYFIVGFIGLIIVMWLVLFWRFRHLFDEDPEKK